MIGREIVRVRQDLNQFKTEPWIPIRKDLGDISYTSRVIADFVLHFVAMVTGVGHGRIYLA